MKDKLIFPGAQAAPAIDPRVEMLLQVVGRMSFELAILRTICFSRGLITQQEWETTAKALIEAEKERQSAPKLYDPAGGEHIVGEPKSEGKA